MPLCGRCNRLAFRCRSTRQQFRSRNQTHYHYHLGGHHQNHKRPTQTQHSITYQHRSNDQEKRSWPMRWQSQQIRRPAASQNPLVAVSATNSSLRSESFMITSQACMWMCNQANMQARPARDRVWRVRPGGHRSSQAAGNVLHTWCWIYARPRATEKLLRLKGRQLLERSEVPRASNPRARLGSR